MNDDVRETTNADRIVSWRHAVTRSVVDDVHVYAIRELFLNAAGDVVAWTLSPLAPVGEFYADLVTTIEWMCEEASSGDVFDIDSRQWVGQ